MTPSRKLQVIRVIHTVVWMLFAVSILMIPWFALSGRDGMAWGLIAFVFLEVLVLAFNRMRCPLTDMAARYTAERQDNFDIFLPLWLARWNKVVFGTLYVMGIVVTVLVAWRDRLE